LIFYSSEKTRNGLQRINFFKSKRKKPYSKILFLINEQSWVKFYFTKRTFKEEL
jgi:hypothetical protein